MYLSDFVFFSVTLSLLALMAIMSAWDHVGHYTDWDKKVHVITSGKLNRPVIVQVPEYQTALRAPKQEVLVECDCRDWATWNNEGIETPACCRNDTVAALKSLVSVLDDSNIKYSLESGTLLGAVRCGEFIQYDYDVDITVESPEPFLVKAALDKWHRHDTDNIFDRMTVHLTGLPWPQTEIEGSYQSHVMVDIHIVDRLTKTRPCLYEGVMMRCTGDYRALLTEKYGKDWMIPHRWDNSRKEGLDEAIDMKQLNHCVEKRETMRHLCEEFPDVIVGEKDCTPKKKLISNEEKLYRLINTPDVNLCKRYHVLKGENAREPDVRICLDNIKPPCNVISVGIAYNFIFDDFMLKQGCRVWSYDPSMRPGNYTRGKLHKFFPIGIGAKDTMNGDKSTLYQQVRNEIQTKTLDTMMTDMDIEYADIVRIDTEGAEWGFINKLNYTKIGQLLIEIHMWKNLANHARAVLGVPHSLFWTAKNGHDNNILYKDMTRVYELGFIRH